MQGCRHVGQKVKRAVSELIDTPGVENGQVGNIYGGGGGQEIEKVCHLPLG